MPLAIDGLATVQDGDRRRSSSPRGHPRPATKRPSVFGIATIMALSGFLAGISQPAQADRIANTTAVFAALDKVTARISKLQVGLGTTEKFGALKVTPRVCYSRPPTEPPNRQS